MLAKLTGSPDDAVADTLNGGSFSRLSGSGPKSIVWDCSAAAATVKVRTTSGAALNASLPACDATMLHWPTACNVTVFPVTVQTAGVVLAKLTASPDDAVADKLNGGSFSRLSGSGPKSIVWDCGAAAATVKVRTTFGAALNASLPACDATMLHWPTPCNVTVFPVTVQTAGVVLAKLTASSDDAVADKLNGGSFSRLSGSGPKSIVWDCGAAAATVKVRTTFGAALNAPLPACDATMLHWPTACNVTVFTVTVQTAGVVLAKLTASSDDAVADKLNGGSFSRLSGSGVKSIVWDCSAAAATVKVRTTFGAALNASLPACDATMLHCRPPVTSRCFPSPYRPQQSCWRSSPAAPTMPSPTR